MRKKLDARTEYIYNHFVSKFYLRYFTFDDKRSITYVTDLSRNKTYPKNVENIAGEDYLNTEDYEKFLGRQYESRYAETLRKIQEMDTMIKQGLQFSSGYLDDFFDFIAFIYSHNLYSRQNLAEAVSNSISEKSNVEYQNIDCHSQDIIPRQLFNFWKEELSKWKFIFSYCSEIPLNYITSDLPITFYSVSSDLLTIQPLKQNFNGTLLYDKDKKLIEFPKTDITDNNASFLMPVTNNAFIFGFKNHSTSGKFRSKLHELGYTVEFRRATNAMILSNAQKYIYSKSKNDIRELNKYLRSNYNEFNHDTYDPFNDP